MGAVIYLFIKLSEVMNLIQYVIQDLKNPKLLNNGPKIKNYTIFWKGKSLKFLNVSSNISFDQFKSPKRGANREIYPKMTFK